MLSLWIFSQLILIGIIKTGDAIYPNEGPSISLAKQGELPYMVRVLSGTYEYSFATCTGAIIDRTHILTAAHCVLYSLKENIRIVAGEVYERTSCRRRSTVRRIHLPEELRGDRKRFEKWYRKRIGIFEEWQEITQKINSSFDGNDIAVLTLSGALPFGDNIQAVNLPDSNYLPYCQLCKFSGWSCDKIDVPSAGCLHWVYFMIKRDQTGQINDSREFKTEDSMLETRPLQGDSGGPLVFNNTVYGVLCRTNVNGFTSTFSKVFAHIDFIRRALKKTAFFV